MCKNVKGVNLPKKIKTACNKIQRKYCDIIYYALSL